MKKKIFSATLLCCAAVLLLAGCSAKKDDGGNDMPNFDTSVPTLGENGWYKSGSNAVS